jgi:hypothetical protein
VLEIAGRLLATLTAGHNNTVSPNSRSCVLSGPLSASARVTTTNVRVSAPPTV